MSERGHGRTLESQIRHFNDESELRRILNIPEGSELAAWMETNKTESALRILDSPDAIVHPDYITEAVAMVK